MSSIGSEMVVLYSAVLMAGPLLMLDDDMHIIIVLSWAKLILLRQVIYCQYILSESKAAHTFTVMMKAYHTI